MQTLRRLVVDEWLGQRRNVYEPFVTLSGLSYELQAREFLNAGHFDSEIGNAMVPFINFTMVENLPVISSSPTTESFYEMPLYLAFTHIGEGHYDAVVLQDSSMIKENQVEGKNNLLQQTLLHKSEPVSCRCGQGRSGKLIKVRRFATIMLVAANAFGRYRLAKTVAAVIRMEVGKISAYHRNPQYAF